MSSPHVTNGDANGHANGFPPATSNGQLETPALTPIGEHGDEGPAPFPSYEEVIEDGDATGKINGRVNGNGHVERPPASTGGRSRGESDHEGSRKSSTPASPRTMNGETPKMLKLSPKQIQELTSSPGSIPMRPADSHDSDIPPLPNGLNAQNQLDTVEEHPREGRKAGVNGLAIFSPHESVPGNTMSFRSVNATPGAVVNPRPGKAMRSTSTPVISRKSSSSRPPKPAPLQLDNAHRDTSSATLKPSRTPDMSQPSPMPPMIPIPPLSLPTYLQLELSSDRPSPLYIHRSATNDFPYESSKVKFERLLNFLRLPPQLEQVLIFGALACLDSWLFTFTILPLRFLKAIGILIQWWTRNAVKEVRDLGAFVYDGIGRMWQRRRRGSSSESRRPSGAEHPSSRRPSEASEALDNPSKPMLKLDTASIAAKERSKKRTGFRHRRTKSTPSALMPNHKADLLQGKDMSFLPPYSSAQASPWLSTVILPEHSG